MAQEGNQRRKSFDILATVVELSGFFRIVFQYTWEILVFSGVLLRLYGLSTRREIWLDESMLLKNVSGISPWNLWGPLESEQVVPPGFLMMLRAIHALAGNDILALRLPSFLAATGAFVIFAFLVRSYCTRPVAIMATALLALNADALYFAQEMKPYAFDQLFTVMILAAIAFHGKYFHFYFRPVVAGFLLVLMPWFSIAAVFPVVAFLLILLVQEMKSGSISKKFIFFSLAWAISFLTTWLIEKSQVVAQSNLWTFWNFAFIKLFAPADSLCLMADNLINPMHLITPLPFAAVMFIWLFVVVLILLTGIFQCKKEKYQWVAFGLLTVTLIIIVSALRFYPFHGRTIFFLMPIVLVVFSEGLIVLGRYAGRWRYLLFGMLLFTPLAGSLWISPFEYHRMIRYDGDLDNDYFLLEYGAMKSLR